MRLTDDEVQEWHEHLLRQRNAYRSFIQDILSGVPTCIGMASPYRSLTLAEIKKRAEELLRDR